MKKDPEDNPSDRPVLASATMPGFRIPRLAVNAAQLPRTFTAFRHYNFRLYFFGLLVSVTGLWAQTVAQEWLVYDLTKSPLALGQVTFVMAIPVWLLGPWAGVVIDRFPKRNILVITQIIQMLQAFALAALTFTGQIEVWHVMLLSGVRGLANAFDAPARQAFVVEMVGKEDLSNAIALNSTMFSLARFVGPAFGALILAWFGTAWAFTFNGVTFLAILLSLVLMRLPKQVIVPSGRSPWADLMEGLRFIWHSKIIIALMVLALSVSLFGSNFSTLIPVVTRETLGRGEIEFGMLKTANGLGSVLGALLVAYLSSQPGRGRRLLLLNMVFPLTLVAFSMAKTYPMALITLVAVGAAYIPQLSLCNMLIQSNIPDEMRGRVMAVYTLIIFGAFPLGALIAGAVADIIGAPLTMLVSAIVVVLIAVGVQIAVPRLRVIE